jgi:hypothetical protein
MDKSYLRRAADWIVGGLKKGWNWLFGYYIFADIELKVDYGIKNKSDGVVVEQATPAVRVHIDSRGRTLHTDTTTGKFISADQARTYL